MKNPRLTGAGILAAGILAAVVNGYMLFSSNKFYPKLLVFTPILLATGAWLLVLGEPIDAVTGKPPLWWAIGMGVAFAGGLIFGILGAVFVGC